MSEEELPAVVLRTSSLGESDLLVTLLTATRGKLRVVARNARKSVRRFAGGLTAGALGLAGVARGRGHWPGLTMFTPMRNHAVLGRDLNKLAYTAYLCELTDELVLERQADAGLFAAVCELLEDVLTKSVNPLLLRRCELVLLDVLGLLPVFTSCCACGASVALDGDGQLGFDANRGGTVCSVHSVGSPSCDRAVVRMAVSLLGERSSSFEISHVPMPLRRELRDLTVGLLRGHLRRPLRSTGFLAQVSER